LITALKRAETGSALVIRLFEPTGHKRSVRLSLPFAGAERRLALGPFEIKTLLFHPQIGRFTEADLLERPVTGE
jgi:hypothetical protein